MKKRILAVILCVCLIVPFMSIAGVQVSAAERKKNFIIKELSQYVSISPDLSLGGVFYTTPGGKMDVMDLSEKGDHAFENVGIMMDTYVAGSSNFVKFFVDRKFEGQLEITSSGACDVEELCVSPRSVIQFADNAWTRVIIPLTMLTNKTGGDFRPANFNFIRFYLQGGGPNYAGEKGTMKIVNWCLVDLSVPEADRPTEEERPVGDGTFQPEAPVYKKVTISPGYDQSVAVYAGYNLKEYIQSHPDVKLTNGAGQTDYAPVVNSLLEGLSADGGGALFIPAGEWDFRSEIVMLPGTTIVGEWQNPDENPQIRGTILKVYCGAGSTEGKAFITMQQHTKINNVSFWYPEQTVYTLAPYPPTIETYQYTFVQNVTLVNSYFGIQNKEGANCPNAWNIYGTPLNIGIDFDMVIDIARIEELHFAANYWADSGLADAPTSVEDYNRLKDQLYDYGIGITLRRIDWSYVTYSDIKGYNIGLLFDKSIDGNYPNGQCVGLNFIDCKYGHFSYGASSSCESLLDITMKNCEYGIYTTGTYNGVVQYYNADIQATQYAVYQDSAYTKVSVMASVIRRGRVYTKNGSNIFINNQILTSAPQIELDYGTVAAILIGNTNSRGGAIEYTNPGNCTISAVDEPMDLKPYTAMTREEAQAQLKKPASANYEIPTELDRTGETDVTEQIQTYLTKLDNNGGGTLFLRPGKYRIDGTFKIPTGVELRGSADFASVPKAVNTMLYIYTPIETGKDEYTSTATVTMEKGSGIRGVIFNYPLQNSTYRTVGEKIYDPVLSNNKTKEEQAKEDEAAKAENRLPETVAPVEVYVQYYEFDFVPYPYTIRGTGSDIYVVNVSVRNGWNGIDFKTYQCDNHYIDYLAGHFFNRGIVIGNGSKNGYVRNFQFNYNSIFQATADIWSGFGGEPSTPELRSAFHQPMQKQFNNNSIILQLGHVENQLVYNCFNYASYIGVHLVKEEESGRAADARIFGHGVDYGTVSLKVEAAEHVEFTNLQLTAFNQAGDNAGTGRYAVEQETNPIYDIWLTKTFDGEITVTNFTEWAPSPTAGVRVDNGVLNMYNAQFSHTKSHLFELNGNGELNIIGFSSTRTDNPPLVDNDPENLHITAGFYATAPAGWEKAGSFDHVYERKYRYSVPKNVVFPEDAEIVFVESFDEYTFSNTSTFQVDNKDAASIRRGAVRLRQTASQYMLSLKAGQDAEKAKPFALECGKTNDLYRMEWRFNVEEMRDTAYSEITLYLSNQDVKNAVIVTITKDGVLKLGNGAPLATIQFGTYYRLALEIDARNANAKTMTIYLLDDNNGVIAKSDVTQLGANFQGTENTVSGFWFVSMADVIDVPETETDLYIDYFYITRSEETTFNRAPAAAKAGDVNGDDKIDSTDARLVLQYAVGKITTLGVEAAADVNRDNKVDSTDARLILQYAVGKIQGF